MPTRVAINGFGRIGRGFVRSAHESGADVEIVAVNDLFEPAVLAQLLARDSVYGPFPGEVTAAGGAIAVGGREIRVLSEHDPATCRGRSWTSTSSSRRPAASAPAPTPSATARPARRR